MSSKIDWFETLTMGLVVLLCIAAVVILAVYAVSIPDGCEVISDNLPRVLRCEYTDSVCYWFRGPGEVECFAN